MSATAPFSMWGRVMTSSQPAATIDIDHRLVIHEPSAVYQFGQSNSCRSEEIRIARQSTRSYDEECIEAMDLHEFRTALRVDGLHSDAAGSKGKENDSHLGPARPVP
jgi:hypothetical protein